MQIHNPRSRKTLSGLTLRLLAATGLLAITGGCSDYRSVAPPTDPVANEPSAADQPEAVTADADENSESPSQPPSELVVP